MQFKIFGKDPTLSILQKKKWQTSKKDLDIALKLMYKSMHNIIFNITRKHTKRQKEIFSPLSLTGLIRKYWIQQLLKKKECKSIANTHLAQKSMLLLINFIIPLEA